MSLEATMEAVRKLEYLSFLEIMKKLFSDSLLRPLKVLAN